MKHHVCLTLLLPVAGIGCGAPESPASAQGQQAAAETPQGGTASAEAASQPAPSSSPSEAPPRPGGDATPDSEPGNVPSATTDVEGATPCPPRDQWPEGMACVLGGTFTLGNDSGRPEERGEGEVYVDTFFMDLREVTNGQYETCIQNGSCERPMHFRHFMGENQPVVAMSWYDAVNHCEMMGRRLPTEAEWERAASGPEGTVYPWGDEPLACERANVKDARGEGCGTGRTHAVGSLEPGHFGLYDMAGNVHEWVQDRYSECLRGCDNECGDACFGRNPRGPCDGTTDRCRGHGMRSVRGGSWYWPLERARAAARRGSGAPNRGPHRFGFRCARDLVVTPPAEANGNPTLTD